MYGRIHDKDYQQKHVDNQQREDRHPTIQSLSKKHDLGNTLFRSHL